MGWADPTTVRCMKRHILLACAIGTLLSAFVGASGQVSDDYIVGSWLGDDDDTQVRIEFHDTKHYSRATTDLTVAIPRTTTLYDNGSWHVEQAKRTDNHGNVEWWGPAFVVLTSDQFSSPSSKVTVFLWVWETGELCTTHRQRLCLAMVR